MAVLTRNSIRIIGGQWRGRRIGFADISGLRPTPDRVRETLFNWLAPIVVGARCLDVFSGSGVLGFEALSRGAKQVLLLDAAPEAIQMIQSNAQRFQIEKDALTVIQAEVPCQLERLKQEKFDIIFLDPPFGRGLIPLVSDWLEQLACFAPNTWIYIETEATLQPLPIPPNWKITRAKKAGQIAYYLIVRESLTV